MRTLEIIAWLLTCATTGGIATGESLPGSQLPLEKNTCATCHGEKFLWEGENQRLFVDLGKLTDDAHWKNGVNCHDCHGGDPTSLDFRQAHTTESGSPDSPIQPFRPLLGNPERSTGKVETLLQVCGKCHAESKGSYLASVHGYGLEHSGLIVTAVCTDCHGSHGIFKADDERSRLNVANATMTCSQCHRHIAERIENSAHGAKYAHVPTVAEAPDASIVQAKPHAPPKRKPGCIDCHKGHDLPHPNSDAFRQNLPDRCGSCHEDLTNSYVASMHGQLTELGYLPAAKCADCHGAHDILPVNAPESRLSSLHRRDTCGKCHPGVNDNFLDYDPHADPTSHQRDSLLYWVNIGLTVLLTSVFAIFGLHSVLWLIRSSHHVVREGRPQNLVPGRRAYLRFRPVHRIAHAVLMTSFLGLALTGLPLRFHKYHWAQMISWFLGGFSSTGLWHRIFGMANFSCLAFYVFWFAWQLINGPRPGVSRKDQIFGPDSPVPHPRDFTDFAKMIRWFLGMGPKPTFERWSYWEKFDLWAASCDIVLIGTTGLILWFPNQFCQFLPGKAINVADLIHGKLALLATGFVFAIHFFSANLRPEKFPMDMSILTGYVSEEEMEHERPEMVQRLREAGLLDEYLTEVPSGWQLKLPRAAGFVALSLGLLLLIAILVALF